MTGGHDELEAIRLIARTRKTHDLAALCGEMQIIAAASTYSERAAIYLLTPDRTKLAMATTPYGYEGDLAEKHRMAPLDSPILGEVIRKLIPLVFSASSLPDAYREASVRAGFVEYAVVPLHSDGVLTGTLNLARTRSEPYAKDIVQLALTLGDQISVQIERARLYLAEKERSESLARVNADLLRSYEELASAQTELIRQERRASLGELAVLVAHEVRNPLGVMFNVAAELRKIPAVPPSASLLVGILEEEAARLERIVHAFLDFGHPITPTFKRVSVRNVVDTAIELTTRALSITAATWHVEVETGASELEADEHLLGQALVSLLTNAAESQSLRGTIYVRARCSGNGGNERLLLSVEDEGTAVDPRILDRVFDPFFTTKASGTGLGLAIVKRNADAHGGEVTIAPGRSKGTIVTMSVPIVAQSSKAGGITAS